MSNRFSRLSKHSLPECRWGAALAALAAVLMSCNDAPAPSPDDGERLTGLAVTTRDGAIQAVIPSAFVVQRYQRSILATTADGTGRLYVGHHPERSVSEALGALKDDLIGLGAEFVEEKHLERATRLVFDEGRRDARQRRRTWIVEDGVGGAILCEAFFPADAESSWVRLVDTLCLEARRVAGGGNDSARRGGDGLTSTPVPADAVVPPSDGPGPDGADATP
jgi:hypothetical protein